MNQNPDIFIYKIPNFITYKKEIIDLIYNTKSTNILSRDEKISLSDYKYSKDKNRNYCNYLSKNILTNFMKDFCNKLNLKQCHISDIWFQIYKKGDTHSLHTHPGCNFTNIIYLSLPNKNIQTKLYTLFKKEIPLTISEGDILTFPGYLPHKSPINFFKEEKIIISFNSNIEINN